MEENDMLKNEAILRYKNIALDMLKYSLPGWSREDLDKALDYSISKRYGQESVKIYNNYTHKTVDGTILDITNYILSREPIITSSGVMWKKHGTVPNPFTELLQSFIDKRTAAKKKMYEYPIGSEMFQKYNLLQLLAKIDANSLYGALGQYKCLFYNLHVAETATTQGRSYTSAALLFFESFLANNVEFASLNEVITFIHNVISEKDKRKYKDSEVLDKDILPEECWYKIMSTAGYFWIPSEEEMEIVWNIINNLSQEDINRLYYKNNLYSFFNNSSMKKSIKYLLKGLVIPFTNPNKAPDEIKVELDELVSIVKEYVYYGYQYIDRLDRVEEMPRDIVIITDTDSNIISLDAWYHFVLNMIQGEDIRIANWKYKPMKKIPKDEFGELIKLRPFEYKPTTIDFDFMNDKIIEEQRAVNPMEIIPQDALRHSIINIMAYICSALIIDYMERYTKNSYSYDPESHKCLIIMKNEFLFKRLLATSGKKNYADIQELKEGNTVPANKSLSIMGMPINKSTLRDKTKETLQKILYDEILNSPTIDQLAVLKKLAIFEKDIIKSLQNGDRSFYKPLTVKAINNYELPMRSQGIKGSIAYNALKDDDYEALDLNSRNAVDIIKTNITRKNIEHLKESNPKKYDQIVNLMDSYKEFDTEISAVALPLSEPVPKWILEFIDYTSIINANLINFPLDSIGLHRFNKTSINYSNILKL